jgi:hypothetical protein
MNVRPVWFTFLSLLWLPPTLAQTPVPLPADLEGDVVNSTTGAPISGARLKLERYPAEPTYTRADAHGHFRFGNLDPGVYTLSAGSPGFLKSSTAYVDLTASRPGGGNGFVRSVISPAGYASAVPAAAIAKSTDSSGAQHAKATVPLLAYGVITGKVTDPYGVPLADTAVEVLAKAPVPANGSASPPARSMQVRTNDKGEFRAASLEPGSYYVVVNKSNAMAPWESSYRITYYGGAIDLAAAKPLAVGAGEQVRGDVSLVRKSGVHVAGRLIKPPGVEGSAGPIVYTNVALVPEQNPLLSANGPFANGRDDYRLDDVLPGRYVLMALSSAASTDPFGSNQKELFGLIRPIEVGNGDVDNFDLTLAPLRDISGTVTYREGCTPAPLHITALNRSPLGWRQPETISDADGKFVLHALTTGRYNFSIFAEAGPGRIMPPVISIRHGARDVLKDGFESPYAGDEPISITVGCQNPGRPQ